MPKRTIDPTRKEEDWYGNNAAITCPCCQKVFIISSFLNKHPKPCPDCGQSRGFVDGNSKTGTGYIEWEADVQAPKIAK